MLGVKNFGHFPKAAPLSTPRIYLWRAGALTSAGVALICLTSLSRLLPFRERRLSICFALHRPLGTLDPSHRMRPFIAEDLAVLQ